jgi:hypothetical protein
MVTSVDPKRFMPLSGPRLTSSQVDTLRAWIDQGATWPAPPPTTKGKPSPPVPSKPVHWSFLPVGRPGLPVVRTQTQLRNLIDNFILARLEAEGIKPSPEADETTLLRRVTLDLTGLPPTTAQLDQFLSDSRQDAYERAVDRLLESSHYGEKWARYWLNLSRYADSDGYEKDNVRPHQQSTAQQASLLEIFYQWSMDHKKLTYRQMGRDFRLTDVSGRVVEKMIA